METNVVYHKDADGFCAAAIAKMAGIEGKYIPIEYGSEPHMVLTGKVYMLDFCLQPFIRMETLNRLCELHWIDHHKSALEAAAKAQFYARGGQSTEIGHAACELTWDYFHSLDPMPEWVKLVGRYDVWDHSGGRPTKAFHYGLLANELDPVTDEGYAFWVSFRDNPYQLYDTVHNGLVIQRYRERSSMGMAQLLAFPLEWEGLRFIAQNRAKAGSSVADSLWNPEEYDAILNFGWVKDQWVIGLYSDKPDIDVSTIAVKYGGGGHKGAAGFQCQELPFALGE